MVLILHQHCCQTSFVYLHQGLKFNSSRLRLIQELEVYSGFSADISAETCLVLTMCYLVSLVYGLKTTTRKTKDLGFHRLQHSCGFSFALFGGLFWRFPMSTLELVQQILLGICKDWSYCLLSILGVASTLLSNAACIVLLISSVWFLSLKQPKTLSLRMRSTILFSTIRSVGVFVH